jgi:hypothetical protein
VQRGHPSSPSLGTLFPGWRIFHSRERARLEGMVLASIATRKRHSLKDRISNRPTWRSNFGRLASHFSTHKVFPQQRLLTQRSYTPHVAIGFHLHHETTHISPFHPTPAFPGGERDILTMPELVTCVKSQSTCSVRYIHGIHSRQTRKPDGQTLAGEALILCGALVHHIDTGKIPRNVIVKP